MSEESFESKAMAMLTRIDEKLNHVCKDVEGHHKTLYGPDGRGGVVRDVEQNKSRQNTWNKLLAIASGLLGVFTTAIAVWLKWGSK